MDLDIYVRRYSNVHLTGSITINFYFILVDLVTLDNLSSEAMLESSQRINQLASTFKRRAEPLSDPGPPGIMPPKVKRANLMVQIVGLLM